MTRTFRIAALAIAAAVFTAASARAEGFFTPFYGYNFGGDSSAYCNSLTNCQDKRSNFGFSFGAMGKVVGFEEDFGYAKDFFGHVEGTDSSVLTLMSNLLLGVGAGPVRPYFLVGIGLIRPHVSGPTDVLSFDNNALGWDIGGGLNVFFSSHVGVRGDIRQLRTFTDFSVPLLTQAQQVDFWRASIGLALKF